MGELYYKAQYHHRSQFLQFLHLCFGPKPTKTHLFLPSGPQNAPKRTLVARYFLRFLNAFFTWQHFKNRLENVLWYTQYVI